MKKFISALASLTAAVTAMSSMLALTTEAAVNGDVDTTIIEFATVDESGNRIHEIHVKPGATVPVDIYVPQSCGAFQLFFHMSINGEETFNDVDGILKYGVHEPYEWRYPGYPNAQYLDEVHNKPYNAGTRWETTEGYMYSNYGIKIQNEKYSEPYCFDAGQTSAGVAGNSHGALSEFVPEAWTILWTHGGGIADHVNVESYNAWEADGKPASGYTPVTKWTKDEPWVYNHPFAEMDLVLPDDIPAGTYVLGNLDAWLGINTQTEQKYSCTGYDENGTQVTSKPDTIEMTIIVDEDATTTTPAPDTTTTTETLPTGTSGTVPSGTLTPTVWGDANCDGACTIADGILLSKYLTGNGTVTDQGLVNADVNADNVLDSLDSKNIREYLAELREPVASP